MGDLQSAIHKIEGLRLKMIAREKTSREKDQYNNAHTCKIQADTLGLALKIIKKEISK